VLRELYEQTVDWVRLAPRWARWGAVGLVALVAALAVARSSGAGGHADPTTARPRGRAAAVGGTVMLRRDGEAVLGVLRTADGATAAAISYVAQRNALLTGGTSAQTAAQVGGALAVGGRDVGADPASIPDRAGAVNTRAMLETRAGQLVWWTIPFGYRLRSFSGARAVVRVFFGLLDASVTAGDGPAALMLNLQDVVLVWRSGAWRLWDVRQAPDQPTVVAAFGLSARREVHSAPVPRRVIRTRERTGVPLFSFLNQATPVLIGPAGMGPVAGGDAVDPDRRAVITALAASLALAVRREGMTRGGRLTARGLWWMASVPVAYRRVSCPSEVHGRCYLVLLVSVTTAGAPALGLLTVAGLVVTGNGASARADGFDMPEAVEQQLLGGQVQVAGVADDQRRMGGAAWARSIRPLVPTMVAAPPR
jgi:hypothetical protein